jgi:hypothetical protein
MPDQDDPLPDPSTPEWSIAWAAKKVLRMHLGPKFDRRLPSFLADAILKHMRLSGWLLSKRPPSPPHSTPGE